MKSFSSPLAKMKLISTGLLGVAVALYATAIVLGSNHPAWGYLTAFSEAAMVGAIADWFAVTALFRHPLGLPIPHTAIIPNNKERIGANLGDFICTHFLSTEQVMGKAAEFDVGGRLAAWLAQADNSKVIGEFTIRLAGHCLEALRDERVRLFIHTTALERLGQVDIGAVCGKLLGLLTADNRHQDVLDEVLEQVDTRLKDEIVQQKIASLLSKELEGVLYFKVLGQMAGNYSTDKLVSRISEWVGEVNADPQHPLREQLDTSIGQFITRLKGDPKFRVRTKELRTELLKHPALSEYLSELWVDLVDWLQDDIASAESVIGRRVTEAAQKIGKTLSEDGQMRAWVNEQIAIVAPALIEKYRGDIGQYIAGRVQAWNTGELVQQLESSIGKDLQFIRINGTLVGGLVGVGIHAMTQLI